MITRQQAIHINTLSSPPVREFHDVACWRLVAFFPVLLGLSIKPLCFLLIQAEMIKGSIPQSWRHISHSFILTYSLVRHSHGYHFFNRVFCTVFRRSSCADALSSFVDWKKGFIGKHVEVEVSHRKDFCNQSPNSSSISTLLKKKPSKLNDCHSRFIGWLFSQWTNQSFCLKRVR